MYASRSIPAVEPSWPSPTLSLQNENFGNALAWIIPRRDRMPYCCTLLFLSLFLYFSLNSTMWMKPQLLNLIPLIRKFGFNYVREVDTLYNYMQSKYKSIAEKKFGKCKRVKFNILYSMY